VRYLTALPALLLAASASAQPSLRPPEQAAGLALMQCVAHSAGMGPITADAGDNLRANGLEPVAEPPPHLQSATQNEYGRGTFAQSPSTEGQVWAIGYDGGVCIVMTLGAAPAPIEGRLKELFAIPDSFEPEPIAPRPGATWSQWRWKRTPRDLIAQMRVTEIPDPRAKGMVMVTVAPSADE
jgi:hypothetical protein